MISKRIVHKSTFSIFLLQRNFSGFEDFKSIYSKTFNIANLNKIQSKAAKLAFPKNISDLLSHRLAPILYPEQLSKDLSKVLVSLLYYTTPDLTNEIKDQIERFVYSLNIEPSFAKFRMDIILNELEHISEKKHKEGLKIIKNFKEFIDGDCTLEIAKNIDVFQQMLTSSAIQSRSDVTESALNKLQNILPEIYPNLSFVDRIILLQIFIHSSQKVYQNNIEFIYKDIFGSLNIINPSELLIFFKHLSHFDKQKMIEKSQFLEKYILDLFDSDENIDVLTELFNVFSPVGSETFWEKTSQYFFNSFISFSDNQIGLTIFTFGTQKRASDNLWRLFAQVVKKKWENISKNNLLFIYLGFKHSGYFSSEIDFERFEDIIFTHEFLVSIDFNNLLILHTSLKKMSNISSFKKSLVGEVLLNESSNYAEKSKLKILEILKNE